MERAPQSTIIFIPSSPMYVVWQACMLYSCFICFRGHPLPCFASLLSSLALFFRLAYEPARFMTSSRNRRSLSSSSLESPFLTAFTPRMASKAIGMVEHNNKYQNKNVKRYDKIYFYRSIFFYRIFVGYSFVPSTARWTA